ncbi:hypothetical protein BAUCODRAFT_452437 [Baudoinia panamericana UAMH 10762]|uniref:Uncharacterized protein n=1 Tax=Baudoinia panamericana (strain UAMH 10762) TaxID=717646 RepID=M2LSI3_BAUPA|nr:uncharacterized protein BAUCODRAFT_452437 [Baudoinia panamericana UAMH 10762]EMC97437.1 hypothetical protein BAUCODRAFT_452437 [Baudoinia panamericana UAMH 10762]
MLAKQPVWENDFYCTNALSRERYYDPRDEVTRPRNSVSHVNGLCSMGSLCAAQPTLDLSSKLLTMQQSAPGTKALKTSLDEGGILCAVRMFTWFFGILGI